MPLYIKLLKEGGGLIQKTDNRELFDYSLEAYKSFGCIIDNVTYDLHGEAGFSKNADGMGSGDVVTEYESRFIGLGMPICRAEVTMPPKESAAEKIRLCEAALKKRKEAAALGRAEPEKRKT